MTTLQFRINAGTPDEVLVQIQEQHATTAFEAMMVFIQPDTETGDVPPGTPWFNPPVSN